MPRKQIVPTQYPQQEMRETVKAFAMIIARAAVNASSKATKKAKLEPDINHITVIHDTSVYNGNIEICLKAKPTQLCLFTEEDR